MDVRIEGKAIPRLRAYTPLEEAGFATADSKAIEIDVTDGVLNIELVPRVGDPKISAIEVVAVE
jgi:hypothetical protein